VVVQAAPEPEVAVRVVATGGHRARCRAAMRAAVVQAAAARGMATAAHQAGRRVAPGEAA